MNTDEEHWVEAMVCERVEAGHLLSWHLGPGAKLVLDYVGRLSLAETVHEYRAKAFADLWVYRAWSFVVDRPMLGHLPFVPSSDCTQLETIRQAVRNTLHEYAQFVKRVQSQTESTFWKSREAVDKLLRNGYGSDFS